LASSGSTARRNQIEIDQEVQARKHQVQTKLGDEIVIGASK
jgi:hypothetical protein